MYFKIVDIKEMGINIINLYHEWSKKITEHTNNISKNTWQDWLFMITGKIDLLLYHLGKGDIISCSGISLGTPLVFLKPVLTKNGQVTQPEPEESSEAQTPNWLGYVALN